ncbi:hypothetical protein ACHAXS_012099 [Conticribra weissflogii]
MSPSRTNLFNNTQFRIHEHIGIFESRTPNISSQRALSKTIGPSPTPTMVAAPEEGGGTGTFDLRDPAGSTRSDPSEGTRGSPQPDDPSTTTTTTTSAPAGPRNLATVVEGRAESQSDASNAGDAGQSSRLWKKRDMTIHSCEEKCNGSIARNRRWNGPSAEKEPGTDERARRTNPSNDNANANRPPSPHGPFLGLPPHGARKFDAKHDRCHSVPRSSGNRSAARSTSNETKYTAGTSITPFHQIPYVHGGYAAAAPLFVTHSKFASILKKLLPNAYVELSCLLRQAKDAQLKKGILGVKRVTSMGSACNDGTPQFDAEYGRNDLVLTETAPSAVMLPDPVKVMKWAENNPVVSAFGIWESDSGRRTKRFMEGIVNLGLDSRSDEISDDCELNRLNEENLQIMENERRERYRAQASIGTDADSSMQLRSMWQYPEQIPPRNHFQPRRRKHPEPEHYSVALSATSSAFEQEHSTIGVRNNRPSYKKPALEWDVFLDPKLVRQVDNAMRVADSLDYKLRKARKLRQKRRLAAKNMKYALNSNTCAVIDVATAGGEREDPVDDFDEELIEAHTAAQIEVDRLVSHLMKRTILAHGSLSQLVLEAFGVAQDYNFGTVVNSSRKDANPTYKRFQRSSSNGIPGLEISSSETWDAEQEQRDFEALLDPALVQSGNAASKDAPRNAAGRNNPVAGQSKGMFMDAWLSIFSKTLKILHTTNSDSIEKKSSSSSSSSSGRRIGQNIEGGNCEGISGPSRPAQIGPQSGVRNLLSKMFLMRRDSSYPDVTKLTATNNEGSDVYCSMANVDLQEEDDGCSSDDNSLAHDDMFPPPKRTNSSAASMCGIFMCLGLDDEDSFPIDKHASHKMAEDIQVISNILGEPLRLVLDLKSRRVPPRVWSRLIDNMRSRGLVVEGIGSFDIDELRVIGKGCSCPLTPILFFHSVGDLQRACHANEVKKGDTVYFNGGSLMWKRPTIMESAERGCCGVIETDIDDNVERRTDLPHAKSPSAPGNYSFQPYAFPRSALSDWERVMCKSTIEDYQRHFNLKIGVYVQEFSVSPEALDALACFVNKYSDIYDLGLAFGGINGTAVTNVEGDGYWNQRYMENGISIKNFFDTINTDVWIENENRTHTVLKKIADGVDPIIRLYHELQNLPQKELHVRIDQLTSDEREKLDRLSSRVNRKTDTSSIALNSTSESIITETPKKFSTGEIDPIHKLFFEMKDLPEEERTNRVRQLSSHELEALDKLEKWFQVTREDEMHLQKEWGKRMAEKKRGAAARRPKKEPRGSKWEGWLANENDTNSKHAWDNFWWRASNTCFEVDYICQVENSTKNGWNWFYIPRSSGKTKSFEQSLFQPSMELKPAMPTYDAVNFANLDVAMSVKASSKLNRHGLHYLNESHFVIRNRQPPIAISTYHTHPMLGLSSRGEICKISSTPIHVVLQSLYNDMIGEFYMRSVLSVYQMMTDHKLLRQPELSTLRHNETNIVDPWEEDVQFYVHLGYFNKKMLSGHQLYLSGLQILRKQQYASSLSSIFNHRKERQVESSGDCKCYQKMVFCGYDIYRQNDTDSTTSIVPIPDSTPMNTLHRVSINYTLWPDEFVNNQGMGRICRFPGRLSTPAKKECKIWAGLRLIVEDYDGNTKEWQFVGLTQRTYRRSWLNLPEVLSRCELAFAHNTTYPRKIACVEINVEQASSPYEQLLIHRSLDAIVGIHGAQLTQAIFLPRHATILELLPWHPKGYSLRGAWTQSRDGPTPLGIIYHNTDLNHYGYSLDRDSVPLCQHVSEEQEEECFMSSENRDKFVWANRNFNVNPDTVEQFILHLLLLGSEKGRKCERLMDGLNDNYVLYNVWCESEEGKGENQVQIGEKILSLHHYYDKK